MSTFLNPLAILVAAIVAYLVGWAWYSPLLWLKPWSRARGTGENWEKDGRKELPKIMVYRLINTIAMTFVIAVFFALTEPQSLTDALQIAMFLCFGCVITERFNHLLNTAYPPHWGKRAQTLFLIDSGYYIVLFLVAGSIIWFLSQ